MFEIEKTGSKLSIEFINYIKEKDRETSDTNWAGIHIIVSTNLFSFETKNSDILSSEVDEIDDLLLDILNSDMKEIKYYEIIEEALNFVFYPKGRYYGQAYDDKGNLLESKEVELSVRIPDEDYLSDASVKFVLSKDDILMLHTYIKNLRED